MSLGYNCGCPCPDPEITEIPGAPGENGENGTNGINAFTVLTANLTIPAIGANVTASVGVSSWAGVGQVVFLSDGVDIGHFEVISIPSSTSLELEFLGYAGDASPAAVIGTGGTVSPSGVATPLSAALPTSITDNSTGTASNTIAAGVGVYEFVIPHTFAAGTGAGEVVTEIVLGHAFKILAWTFVTDVPGVGAGASRVFNMEIGGTDVGTVVSTVTCTEASTSAKGELTAGTAVAGANTGTAADSFSIEVAAGGTAFSAGSGSFVVRVQNMDAANAFASLADHVNDLITALNP